MKVFGANIYMYCEDISRVSIQMEYERVPLLTRLSHSFHLLHCKACRSFLAQSKIIDRAIKDFFSSKNSFLPTEVAKNKWKKEVEAAIRNRNKE